MIKSDSIKELATALAKAQAEIENASKNAANPHFKSRYADLAEVLNTVRPVFSKHGLAVMQMPSFADGVASIETLLTHASGEWISNIASAPVSKQDAQGVGSALTYLRRYSLAAFAGVAQEDDDGESAIGRHKKANKMPGQALADWTKRIGSALTMESLKSEYDAAVSAADGDQEAIDAIGAAAGTRKHALKEAQA